MVMFVASLIGVNLASSETLATLPVTFSIVGLALGIFPVAWTTERIGRKKCFMLFLWIGAFACYLSSKAIEASSFTGFCFGIFLLGFALAAVQQFRYAAIECLGVDRAPTAASIILSGGIFAAFAGPEIAVAGKNFTETDYEGSFWLASLSLILASLILSMFKPAKLESADKTTSSTKFADLVNRKFCVAIASGVIGYGVMSFVMTATPISMHHMFMHSLEETKWVVQSHIAAMFLPSLISPLLFRWLGTINMMKLGVAAFVITIVVGYNFTSVAGFWVQLVALGIGWNFLFVAGTSLLSESYSSENALKAQAVNDGMIFGVQALTSVAAGISMAHMNWAGLLTLSLVPTVLFALLLAWYLTNSRNQKNSTE